MTDDAQAQALAAGERVAERYRAIHERAMRGLPVCNPLLEVAASGFRWHAGHAVGVVTTPWFMNIVALPHGPDGPVANGRPGDVVSLPVPGGLAEWTVTELDGLGRFGVCALFSPMDEFDAETAAAAAEAAMTALFDPALLLPPPAPRNLDRRALLRGRLSSEKADAEAAAP